MEEFNRNVNEIRRILLGDEITKGFLYRIEETIVKQEQHEKDDAKNFAEIKSGLNEIKGALLGQFEHPGLVELIRNLTAKTQETADELKDQRKEIDELKSFKNRTKGVLAFCAIVLPFLGDIFHGFFTFCFKYITGKH